MNRLDAPEGVITATQSATREAVESISSIRGTIQALDQVSAAIAAALEEQSVVTREMPKTMQTALLSVSGIARSVDAIARASENINRATRQVREASRAVA